MIIVNYYTSEDYNKETDGYYLHLAGVVNDMLNLDADPELIKECIDNDTDFEPKAGVMYELQLIRACISADPMPEPAFAIDRIIEIPIDKNLGYHVRPLVYL